MRVSMYGVCCVKFELILIQPKKVVGVVAQCDYRKSRDICRDAINKMLKKYKSLFTCEGKGIEGHLPSGN